MSVNVMASTSPLVDPTKPLNHKMQLLHKQEAQPLPKLQTILFDGKKGKAILNNDLYQVGQSVGGYKIVAIKKETVLLRYKSKSYKLALYTKEERFTK